jgi:uncharacterized protein (TIGR02757 family)
MKKNPSKSENSTGSCLVQKDLICSQLKALRVKYEKPEYLFSDPIHLVHPYKDPRDLEIAALITALFSYGNVRAICKFLANLFSSMENSPYQFLSNPKNLARLKGQLGVYRFQKEADIIEFLRVLSEIINENKSQKNSPIFEIYFLDYKESSSPSNSLQSAQTGILEFQKNIQERLSFSSYGLNFLIGKPNKKAPNKRYNMFLRWMVGKNYPDFGYYTKIQESSILLPLDTHIIKIGKVLDLTKRNQPNLAMAQEITNTLSSIVNEPASRYDFALSRIGILGKCRGEYVDNICGTCEIQNICQHFLLSKLRSNPKV